MSKRMYEFPMTEVVVVNIESGLLTDTTQGVQGNRSGYGTDVEDTWN